MTALINDCITIPIIIIGLFCLICSCDLLKFARAICQVVGMKDLFVCQSADYELITMREADRSLLLPNHDAHWTLLVSDFYGEACRTLFTFLSADVERDLAIIYIYQVFATNLILQ